MNRFDRLIIPKFPTCIKIQITSTDKRQKHIIRTSSPVHSYSE